MPVKMAVGCWPLKCVKVTQTLTHPRSKLKGSHLINPLHTCSLHPSTIATQCLTPDRHV